MKRLLKRLVKRFEDAIAAVAFAEVGEVESARGILREENSLFEQVKRLRHKVDLTLDEIGNLTSRAITFAGAGEVEKAEKIIAEANTRSGCVKEISQKISNVIPTPKVI